MSEKEIQTERERERDGEGDRKSASAVQMLKNDTKKTSTLIQNRFVA